MAKSTSQSKLMTRLKNKTKGSWKRARKAEAQAKGQRLPAGLQNATARFSEWKLAEDKNSNPYFVLTGIVEEPEEHGGKKVQLMHFISETENRTVEQKLEKLTSDLKLLGCVDVEECELDELPDLLDGLAEEAPLFLFNTWQPKDSDDVFVFIQGLAEDEGVDEEDDEDLDEEEDEEEEEDDDEILDEDEEEEEAYEDDEEYEDEEEEDDEEEDWQPSKGETYGYKATARAKAADATVTSVNAKQQTVNLKRTGDGKLFKAVPWDKLLDA